MRAMIMGDIYHLKPTAMTSHWNHWCGPPECTNYYDLVAFSPSLDPEYKELGVWGFWHKHLLIELGVQP